MSSKCCNVDLVPVLYSKPPAQTYDTYFNASGFTMVAQYCSRCGKIDRTKSTPVDTPEFCKEAIR